MYVHVYLAIVAGKNLSQASAHDSWLAMLVYYTQVHAVMLLGAAKSQRLKSITCPDKKQGHAPTVLRVLVHDCGLALVQRRHGTHILSEWLWSSMSLWSGACSS